MVFAMCEIAVTAWFVWFQPSISRALSSHVVTKTRRAVGGVSFFKFSCEASGACVRSFELVHALLSPFYDEGPPYC